MMSWQARILKTLMRYQMAYLLRSDDPLIRRARIEKAGRFLKSPPDVVSEPVSAGGVPSEWITTPAADHEQVILHLHSGGYYTGSINTHRDLVARLGRAAGMRALAIDYRLAPEHPYPAALEDATTAYRWLVATGYEPANIIIAGDSSGGGLALAMLVNLRDAGDPLPAGAVCLSPWTDLALTGGSIKSKAKADPINKPDVLKFGAALYAGQYDLKTPLISPLYAELRELPPILIQVGTEETLLDDSTRLAEHARAAGVEVTLEIWKGMIHDFQLYARFLPEARQAIEGVGMFMRRRIHSEARSPSMGDT
jgi:acetyl esterase/lipase